MALDMTPAEILADAPKKDLYEMGEMPPLGHVPAQMRAWTIRRERHGSPDTAMQLEVVDTPTLDSNEVLVLVMAAGVNYNGVWAAKGEPISPFDVHGEPFHIAGSDASGIIWAVGDPGVRHKTRPTNKSRRRENQHPGSLRYALQPAAIRNWPRVRNLTRGKFRETESIMKTPS